jgi:hypothetical protein
MLEHRAKKREPVFRQVELHPLDAGTGASNFSATNAAEISFAADSDGRR